MYGIEQIKRPFVDDVFLPRFSVIEIYKARRLSVAECLAIQSLPKTFSLPEEMSLSDCFKTIGNGVVKPLIQEVSMSNHISPINILEFFFIYTNNNFYNYTIAFFSFFLLSQHVHFSFRTKK